MRKLLSPLAAAAVLAGLTVPTSAIAAGHNDIRYSVASSGAWTYEPNGVVRNKTTAGSMVLNVNDLADGGLCVRLVNANTGTVFTGTTCWNAGQYGSKTLATNVRAGTRFRVQAQKRALGSNNAWGAYRAGGSFYY